MFSDWKLSLWDSVHDAAAAPSPIKTDLGRAYHVRDFAMGFLKVVQWSWAWCWGKTAAGSCFCSSEHKEASVNRRNLNGKGLLYCVRSGMDCLGVCQGLLLKAEVFINVRVTVVDGTEAAFWNGKEMLFPWGSLTGTAQPGKLEPAPRLMAQARGSGSRVFCWWLFSRWEVSSWIMNLAKIGYQKIKRVAEERTGCCRRNGGLTFRHLIKKGGILRGRQVVLISYHWISTSLFSPPPLFFFLLFF